MAKGYVGWLLPEHERARLTALKPPKYKNVIAHHVTLAFGVDDTYPLPLKLPAHILGWADDGTGVECAIVEIGGNLERSDGGVFHITWSLEDGRKPVESNVVAKQWARLEDELDLTLQTICFHPEPIELIPTFFPF